MANIKIYPDLKKGKINKNIYGHFAEHLGRCIYEGVWVGVDSPIPNTRGFRNDVLEALIKINIPVLRWPGGCFADEYHWKDGVGPRENRKKIINTHWGGVVENNHFGTHEFMDLCELLNCEPYICGNVGSGTVQEMQEWIEYITFDGDSPMANWRKLNGRDKPWKLKYFGVGNENWCCGGNMRPEYYADEYRRYQTYIRNFGESRIYKIACGSNDFNFEWTETLMKEAGRLMNGLNLHYYAVSGNDWRGKRSATEFTEEEWFITLKAALLTDEIISKHSAIMDHYDPQKHVGMIVDEWGNWFDVEPGTNPGFLYQQNTMRDALTAGISLNIFNQHCDRVHMANIAQMINVLQSVILTEGDKMILTPTYHVFDMYKVHQNADLLIYTMECNDYRINEEKIPQLSVSASKDSNGKIHITLCNLNPEELADLTIELQGANISKVSGKILTSLSMNAHNTFDEPDQVKPTDYNQAKLDREGIISTILPPKSVTLLTLE